MSLLEKWGKALEHLDMDSLNEIYHDDYEFILHSAGRTLNKKDVIDWIAMDENLLDAIICPTGSPAWKSSDNTF